MTPLKHLQNTPQITIRYFNSDSSYLPSLTCNMDVRVHISISGDRYTPWYGHVVVKNDNFTLLLTSSGQEWQFHIATDI